MLPTFQKATGSPDPTTDAEFGDGALMRQGFTLLWMGWQWDVPERPGTMRMEMPIATENGTPDHRPRPRQLHPQRARRRPRRSPIAITRRIRCSIRNAADNVMTVRDDPTAKGQVDRRARAGASSTAGTVALDGGFEPGRIYDVVYRSADPRVVGFGLAGTRDLISFFKYDTSAGEPDAAACATRSAGACRRAAASSATFSIRASTRTSRDAACSTACSIRSAARAADRSTTASARRRATRCSIFNILFPGRSVSVHRRPVDRSRDRRDRQPARARRAHRHRAEGLSPADQLRVLQPRRLAGAHRSDRNEGRRAAGEHAHLHDRVGAARTRSVSAGVERRRRHDRPRGAQSAELLARRARAVPRARSLGRRGRGAAAERVPADRRRHADVARPRRLAGRFPAISCRSSRCARSI